MSSKIKNKRKEEIFEAAKKVFFEKGYNNTSMEDIINETDLSKGGVYYYFKNKEDLCLNLLYETTMKYHELAGNITYYDDDKNPIKNVCNYFTNFLIQDIEEIKIISTIYIETRHDKKLQAEINEKFNGHNVNHILHFISQDFIIEDESYLENKLVYFMDVFHSMLYYKFIEDVNYSQNEELIKNMFYNIFDDINLIPKN